MMAHKIMCTIYYRAFSFASHHTQNSYRSRYTMLCVISVVIDVICFWLCYYIFFLFLCSSVGVLTPPPHVCCLSCSLSPPPRATSPHFSSTLPPPHPLPPVHTWHYIYFYASLMFCYLIKLLSFPCLNYVCTLIVNCTHTKKHTYEVEKIRSSSTPKNSNNNINKHR